MIKHLYIFILVVCLSACASTQTKNKVEGLEESVKNYNIALRWAEYLDAQKYHVSKDGAKQNIDLDYLKNIRITGYTIQSKVLNDDVTEALINTEINYYNVEYGTLKKLMNEQKWWYEPESKRWFVESEFPSFK